VNVSVYPVGVDDEEAFLEAVHRSRSLMEGWVNPPDTSEAFARHLERYSPDSNCSFLATCGDGGLVGCINLNEIIRGAFQSAYLGYYAFEPNNGKGLMKKAMASVISIAFHEMELHRLEANIQPTNAKSIGLAKALGFRLEGFPPRYLNIDGAWRDHERYAITREEWSASLDRVPAKEVVS
jgi:[ribosomal protein S5]-alanine N-acetyltransferase